MAKKKVKKKIQERIDNLPGGYSQQRRSSPPKRRTDFSLSSPILPIPIFISLTIKMKAIAAVFSLALPIFFFFSGVQSATFTIKNNCAYTIWPGTLTGGGKPQLPSTGFELGPGASQTLDVPDGWSGRFFARTGCSASSGKFSCDTADCGSGQMACSGAGAIPPATLVELTLAENGGQDFYDVSLVDGFNLPVALALQGGSSGCQSTSCPANVNAVCPPELAMKRPDGAIIACKSAVLQDP
ncbi:hypothetical protein L484_022591 [Morus notabilis]|uniref:Thaumatin-like protein 1 n=1 Tax=Morus notabilis TaxID=981085 RepID=W9RX28_9ROSA|nr:hypothetical protein L484_022591 [Morus notabilis]